MNCVSEYDLVKMARKSGLSHPEMTAEGNSVSIARMARFADLVARNAREICAQWVRDNYQDYPTIAGLCDAMMELRRPISPAECIEEIQDATDDLARDNDWAQERALDDAQRAQDINETWGNHG